MQNQAVVNAAAYIPLDRREAIASGRPLPAQAEGAALFADLSGFTPLTEACARAYGPQRGAEVTTRSLNEVYTPLIAEIQRHGGVVVGFSGDGLTCWFGNYSDDYSARDLIQTTLAAVACATALHAELARVARVPAGDEVIELRLKVAISAGRVYRMAVGNPAIHLTDAIAGAPVAALGRLESAARPGETVLDAATARLIKAHVGVRWRPFPNANRHNERLGVLHADSRVSQTQPKPLYPSPPINGESIRPWIQPAIYARLQAGGDAFLAELRPAVALFLGFDGLDFDLDADAPDKLNRFVGWVQGALAQYDGLLLQLTMGDKGNYLYAAFGAPTAHDNDIVRALGAALTLRRPLTDLDFTPAIRMGLAQGRMRVGPYGSESRCTYGVQGSAVNLAARLMMQAQPGELLLNRTVAAGARSFFQIQAIGAIPLKGLTAPESVYTVGGPVQPVAFVQLPDNTAPLIGREAEMRCLQEMLRATQSGTGGLLRIEAELGLGKSRLLAAFARHALDEPIFLAVAAGQIITRTTAYATANQIGGQLFGLQRPELIDDDARIARIEALLQQLNPALLPRLPLLGDVLNLPIADNATTAGMEPKVRRTALHTLAEEIIRELARIQPVLILVEDIHWLDEASARLLAALGRAAGTMRLLIVTTQRPADEQAEFPPLEQDELPHQERLTLAELSDKEVAALASIRVGGSLAPVAQDFVQAQSHGNPFFVEELLDNLLETKDLLQESDATWALSPAFMQRLQRAGCVEWRGDGWRLKSRIDLAAADIGLPDSIHGIVLARLDRLPEEVQLTVKIASVIGRVFERALLAASHPQRLDEAALTKHMNVLEDRGFAHRESAESDAVYLFRHNVIQEVSYRTLLDLQRRSLHGTVALQLESLQPGATDRLALHFFHSDTASPIMSAKALHYLDAAAARAKHDYANEIALTYLNRTLSLEESWQRYQDQAQVLHILGRREEESAALARLNDQPDAPRLMGLLLWSKYYDAVSDYDAARAVLRQALAQCGPDDGRMAAQCRAQLGLIAWRLGNYEEAGEHYAAALDALPDSEEAAGEAAEIYYGLGLVDRQLGRYHAAIERFERTLALRRQTANRDGEAQALKAIGLTRKHMQEHRIALDYYTRSLALYRTIGARSGEGECLLNMAEVYSLDGAHDRAASLLEVALEIQRELDNAWWQIRILNGLGIVHMLTGRHAEALYALEEGLSLATSLDDAAGRAYLQCNVGQVYAQRGELDAAQKRFVEGYALAEAQQDRHLQALYRSEMALVALEQNEYEAAIRHAKAAIEGFSALEMATSAATDWATLAQAYLRQGRPKQAAACAAAALALPVTEVEQVTAYPQRVYVLCYTTLAELDQRQEAQSALETARGILQRRADALTDESTRESFLTNLAFNRAISATG
ncbi:MAG: tetratricopeptide repeat protein [Caldilineaceae bacterium]|nr:tetratricopeptide repeat protein [Caldilineaceae bacterium]